jgi:hypothetical protein
MDYPGPADMLQISKGQTIQVGLPRTIFISANLGNDTIKLVEVLKELKYCTQSVENRAKN